MNVWPYLKSNKSQTLGLIYEVEVVYINNMNLWMRELTRSSAPVSYTEVSMIPLFNRGKEGTKKSKMLFHLSAKCCLSGAEEPPHTRD